LFLVSDFDDHWLLTQEIFFYLQLAVFGCRNLLETNKPYLMNTFRMPAIQTLFLFGHSIDSDPSFTRFIFDSWLEVEFADSAAARSLCITAMELRENWLKLLDQRLTQSMFSDLQKAMFHPHILSAFI